jgi:hypothetical protein
VVDTTDVQLFVNNKSATLSGTVEVVDTSIVLSAGQGASWPSPTATQYFALTLQNPGSGAFEVCYCTNRTGDILAVDRAQEGTTALQHLTASTVVQCRLTKGSMEKFVQKRFTGADVGKFLEVQADGQVLASPGSGTLPSNISYIDALEVHTKGKSTAEYDLTPDVIGSAVSLDSTDSNTFYFKLEGNRTMSFLANGIDGQVLSLVVQQDATGGRTFSFTGANVRVANEDIDLAVNAHTHYSIRWVDATAVWLVVGVSGFVVA